nr:FKBP-type peptidyl-prolyl cis-trans isomerase [uncultured Undibacterium sp.]
MKFSWLLVMGLCVLSLSGCQRSDGPAAQENLARGSAQVRELKMIDEVLGGGTEARTGNAVTVHYTGWLYDVRLANLQGSKFDSSLDRGTPFTFTLGAQQVIKGWDVGVAGMRVGGKRRLIIPSDMAYGSGGRGPIPDNAALVFEVLLVDVK